MVERCRGAGIEMRPGDRVVDGQHPFARQAGERRHVLGDAVRDRDQSTGLGVGVAGEGGGEVVAPGGTSVVAGDLEPVVLGHDQWGAAAREALRPEGDQIERGGGGDDAVRAAALEIAREAREMAELAARRPVGRDGGEQGARRARVGAHGAQVGADRAAALQHHHPGRRRDHVGEVVPLPPDDQVDGAAGRDQATGQAQERGADPAAAEAPEQERDAATLGRAQASASMLMVSVRRSLPAGPTLPAPLDSLEKMLENIREESRQNSNLDREMLIKKILNSADSSQLGKFLYGYSPNTIAHVLTSLSPERAATILRQIPQDKQEEILSLLPTDFRILIEKT